MHEMTAALAEAGHEVHLVTLGGRGDAPPPPAVELHPVKLLEPNYLARALAFRDRVARLLVGLAPDVVHFRGIFEGEAAVLYAERRGIPTVFEVNGLPSVELVYHHRGVSRAFETKLRALEARLLDAVSSVVTQSRTTLAFLRDRGLSERKLATVIPNGADAMPQAAQHSHDHLSVFYAGTLAPWQGVRELLMATRRVLRERPMRLTIAGSAPRRHQRQLERALRKLKLVEAVDLTGPLDRTALAERIAASDVCTAPLRRDRRNRTQGSSPIKLFEYMSAGRAILTTDLPCVREIVEPERTAITVHAPRPVLLAEQLLRLAGDAELRARRGTAARAYVLEHATWASRRAALRDHYRRAAL